MKNWKDVIQYGTAVGALTSGIVLAYINYFDIQDLTNGVLGYVAQTLIYAGSIFGVTMYWNGKYGELKAVVDRNKDEIDNINAKVVGSSSEHAV